ncbi:carbohydrate ABC transporter substrate-binding protein (CUT1 family) [Planomicrobium soli]|uniref:Carbohydrate ABC transporter substrate-binding protein (CUT1 family) n=1 Tax=Planomicrobium soli TaxID=1176648 RepID=A0A2P8GQQ1_9BACL|nr:extracellular solute-binding protein [Planomicrobium soli]PSL36265.1 carbohydrate ABC transporter substrate-binding protein (CUT1 family) [Planomicrobium soli]
MNKKTKRNLLFGLLTSLLFITTACGGEQESNAGSGEEGTTVTFLTNNEVNLEGVQAVADEIKEKHNITTKFEIIPSGGEGENIIKTRLSTGEMTDILNHNSGSLFKSLRPEEYFLDISDEPYIDKIQESFLETVSVDDEIYGVPFESALAGGWLYNKKVYEELGLEVPHTWEQLMENNKVIKEAGKIPAVAPYEETWTSQVVLLADYYNVHSEMPDFAEKFTNNEVKFADTPLALRGFEKIQELQKAGYYNDEETSTTYEDGMRMVATGEAAHFPILTFALTQMAENHPDEMDDVGFFGQPGDDADNHGMTLWMPNGIYINKESENAEAAKTWLEYFMSEEGLATFMSKTKAIGPSVVEGVELPDDAYEAVKDMTHYVESGKVAPALEFLSPLKGPNLQQITVEVGLDMVPAKEGADKYDRDVERQAQQLGLEGW